MSVFSHRDFGQHEKVVFGYDQASGLKAIVAIHNTALGPALGGCRMYPYQSEQAALADVLRLSQGMTYKSALANLPLGGGKSVIIGDPLHDKTPALFEAMATFINGLSGDYIIAQDSGTSVADMKAMADRTDFVAGGENFLDEFGKVVQGDPSPATAYGVFTGLKAAVHHKLKRENLRGLKVAIQGVGNVGFGLAKHLSESGAELYVADISDSNVSRAVNECGAVAVSNHKICSLAVDVFAPCALGGAIHSENIDTIRAPIIAGAANNQLAEARYDRLLYDRGVLYVPDFALNAGGIILIYHLRNNKPWSDAKQHIEGISDTLMAIFKQSDKTGETPVVVANRFAEQRIRTALSWKRDSAPRGSAYLSSRGNQSLTI